MVSNTHNNLPGEQEQDTHSFAERVKKGAENAVHCMGVNASDRVVILTDYKREGIARLVADAAITLPRRCLGTLPRTLWRASTDRLFR